MFSGDALIFIVFMPSWFKPGIHWRKAAEHQIPGHFGPMRHRPTSTSWDEVVLGGWAARPVLASMLLQGPGVWRCALCDWASARCREVARN